MKEVVRPKDIQTGLPRKALAGCYGGLVTAKVKGRMGMSKGVDLHVGSLEVGKSAQGRRIRPAVPSVSSSHRTLRACSARSCDDGRTGIAGGGHGIEPATTHPEENPSPGLQH